MGIIIIILVQVKLKNLLFYNVLGKLKYYHTFKERLALHHQKINCMVNFQFRTNDFSELFNTELASTRMRAGVCISGCMNSGINVLPPNYGNRLTIRYCFYGKVCAG